MRRVGWLVVATVFLVLVPLSAPAGAAADIILKFDDIQGESVHDCTDVFCTPTVSEYIYTGAGSCMQNCVGLPVGQAVTTLTFSISRLAKDGCTAKAGTGTLDVQWPDDLAAPSTQGVHLQSQGLEDADALGTADHLHGRRPVPAGADPRQGRVPAEPVRRWGDVGDARFHGIARRT
jgi:hypothetical protein